MQSVVALLRACITLLAELVFGRLPLDGARLSLRTKGIDRSLLNSLKGRDLKAFVDGSVLEDGSCGCGIYYRDGHYLNFSGGFAAASASSNLAELAALFFALLRHPKGQHLSIFSDSAFALHVVQSVSTEAECDLSTSAATRKRNRRAGRINAIACPKLTHGSRLLRTASGGSCVCAQRRQSSTRCLRTRASRRTIAPTPSPDKGQRQGPFMSYHGVPPHGRFSFC